MPTSGSSGCAIREVADGGRFRHHPHPAVLGGLPDRRRATRPPMSTRSAGGGGGLSRQGGPDRRGRLAERRPHARGRAAVAGQPGARDPGRAGAGKREHFRVNVIEAFDQPWKRALEGTVGGHWGLFDDDTRAAQIRLGRAGVQSSALALAGGRRRRLRGADFRRGVCRSTRQASRRVLWLAVTANAIAGGVLIGWSGRQRAAGKSRRRRLAALAARWPRSRLLSPPLVSAAIMRGAPVPRLSRVLGPAPHRERDPLALAAGALLIATVLLALNAALGLVFDPRYKDFPFAPLTAAVVPLLMHTLRRSRGGGRAGAAELRRRGDAGACRCPTSRSTRRFANWQSLWLCARASPAWPLFWCGCATRKAEHEQAGGQRRQADIVEHERRDNWRRSASANSDQRRPQQIERAPQCERRPAEHGMLEQRRSAIWREAQSQVSSPAVAGKSDSRLLDRADSADKARSRASRSRRSAGQLAARALGRNSFMPRHMPAAQRGQGCASASPA